MTIHNSSFLFLLILSVSISLIIFENSFAQEDYVNSPRNQWEQLPDPDKLTCKDGLILLQKTNGFPSCVSPYTFLKLIDRGYGKFDSSQLMNRPDMMANLMKSMVADSQLMNHWHTMMINDSKALQQTMSNLIFQLKENPEFMANIMVLMINNPELREQMIEDMKNHSQMMISFQKHPGWMHSVHQPIMNSNMKKKMNSVTNEDYDCSWCQEIKQNNLPTHQDFHNPQTMENMLHHLWINENMRTQMHDFMFKNPNHMSLMTNSMTKPILKKMMDEPELRGQMIEMMLEDQEFMDSIRHQNKILD